MSFELRVIDTRPASCSLLAAPNNVIRESTLVHTERTHDKNRSKTRDRAVSATESWETTAARVWAWRFWINGSLHMLFLIVMLIAFLRS